MISSPTRTFALVVAATLLANCSVSPSTTSPATGNSSALALSTTNPPATTTAATQAPVCTTPTARPSRSPIVPLLPIVDFTRANGGSAKLGSIELLDAATQTLTIVYPNITTGGLPPGAPASFRVTVRVTDASVLQQVSAVAVPLTAAGTFGKPTFRVRADGPALPAKAPVVVVNIDRCGIETGRYSTTLAEAVPAGASEWTVTNAPGFDAGVGSKVVYSVIKPLAFAELKVGDALTGTPGHLASAEFTGNPPTYTLVRLTRACLDDACPSYPALP